jgi:hypothetical protein
MAPAWQRQSLAWAEEKKGCYQSLRRLYQGPHERGPEAQRLSW